MWSGAPELFAAELGFFYDKGPKEASIIILKCTDKENAFRARRLLQGDSRKGRVLGTPGFKFSAKRFNAEEDEQGERWRERSPKPP